jgi:hypothetical protein
LTKKKIIQENKMDPPSKIVLLKKIWHHSLRRKTVYKIQHTNTRLHGKLTQKRLPFQLALKTTED